MSAEQPLLTSTNELFLLNSLEYETVDRTFLQVKNWS